MLRFDDEGSRRLVAAYLTPDVVAQRPVSATGWSCDPEQGARRGRRSWLPGRRDGRGGRADGLVAGIDVSDRVGALAKGRDAAVDLRAGSAGSIPYPDASFDVAVSTQVLEVMCSHSLGMRSRNANRLSGF